MESTPIIQISLADETYRRVRNDIFNNRWGPGERIDIAEIAERFAISRQPVKEAINRLANEGLLVIRPRVGTFVRNLSRRDIENLMKVRLMMETFSVRHAVLDLSRLNGLEETLKDMDRVVDAGEFDYLAYNEKDIQFHRQLVELTENDLLTNTYMHLNAHYVTARAFFTTAWRKTLSSHEHHRSVLEALSTEDREEAARVVALHIEEALRELNRILDASHSDIL